MRNVSSSFANLVANLQVPNPFPLSTSSNINKRSPNKNWPGWIALAYCACAMQNRLKKSQFKPGFKYKYVYVNLVCSSNLPSAALFSTFVTLALHCREVMPRELVKRTENGTAQNPLVYVSFTLFLQFFKSCFIAKRNFIAKQNLNICHSIVD